MIKKYLIILILVCLWLGLIKGISSVRQQLSLKLDCYDNNIIRTLDYRDTQNIDYDKQYIVDVSIQILSQKFLPILVSVYPTNQLPSDFSSLSNLANNKNVDKQSVFLHQRTQRVSLKLTGQQISNQQLRLFVFWVDLSNLPYLANNNLGIQIINGKIQCINDVDIRLTASLQLVDDNQSVNCQGLHNIDQYCQCQNDYYGPRCLQKIIKITQLSSKQIIVLNQNQQKYFSIEIPPQELAISQDKQYPKLGIKIDSQKSDLSDIIIMWRKQDNNISQKQLLSTNIFNQNNPAYIQNIQLNPQKQRILVTIYSNPINPSIIELHVYKKYSSQEKLIFIIVAISLSIGVMLLLILLFYCLYCRTIRNWNQGAVAVPSRISPFRYTSAIVNFHLDNDEHFPEITYNQFIQQISIGKIHGQNQLPNDCCAICLEKFSFQCEKPLRYTYCNHLFHGCCFIQWKNRQANCPLCREQLILPVAINWQQRISKILDQIPQCQFRKYKATYLYHNRNSSPNPQNNEQQTSHNLILRNNQ